MPPVPPAFAGWARADPPQPGAVQAATAVRSPRLLGPGPQLCSAAAAAGRQRCRSELLARQGCGLRPGHFRWLQLGRALGHRRAGDLQGGLGRRVIEELLHTPPVVRSGCI